MKLVVIFIFVCLSGNDARRKPIKRAQRTSGDVLRNLRIMGGSEVKNISDYPFTGVIIEQIGYTTAFYCACAKVARYFALTTAGCATSTIKNTYKNGHVFVRGNTRQWKFYGNDDHTVIMIKQHPKFNRTSYDYDVAIVQVFQPFDSVSWLRLPPTKIYYEKAREITTLGWGVHEMSGIGDPVNELFAITLSIVDWNECKSNFNGSLSTRMFCAGAKYNGPCTHDAGGPVYTVDKKIKYLIGLVSYTFNGLCGVSSYTSIFTNLYEMHDWISTRIKRKLSEADEFDDDADESR